jgi:hypothetical protein
MIKKTSIFLTLFVLTQLSSALAEGNAQIRGTVTGIDGIPAAETRVYVMSVFGNFVIASTTTATDGTFLLSSVAPGAYGLVATKDKKYCAISAAFMATSDRTSVASLHLTNWSLCSTSVQFATPENTQRR